MSTQTDKTRIKGFGDMIEAPHFVGDHIKEIAHVMTVALIARSHTLLIGSPGTGKTAPMESYADQVVGPHKTAVLYCDESNEPAEVKGSYDKAKFMATGQLERIVANKPWDPNMELVILDELGRTNGIVHNILISSVLNPTYWKRTHGTKGPVAFATSNFMPSEDRMAALSDRIDLWVWPKVGQIDVEAATEATLLGIISGTGPQTPIPSGVNWAMIEELRDVKPTQKSIDLIKAFNAHVANAAREDGFNGIQYRRVNQWTRALFYATLLETGTANFDKIPAKAARILRYCHTSMTEEEADRWGQVIDNVSDQAPVIIQNRLLKTRQILEALRTADPDQRTDLLTAASEEIQQLQVDLTRDVGDDPRIRPTVAKAREWLSQAIRGEDFGDDLDQED